MTSSTTTPLPSKALHPAPAPEYKRLVREWWRWKFDEAWLAADHLLIVRTRFFRERYLRLHWADIAALLFFPAGRNQGLMLWAEAICLLTAPVLVLFGSPSNTGFFFTAPRIARLSVTLTSIVFYAIWRMTRRRWQLQIITLTGRATIPLAITQARSARYVDQLKQKVVAAQPQIDPSDPHGIERSVQPSPEANTAAEPPPELHQDQRALSDRSQKLTVFLGQNEAEKRPVVALHAAVFLLGIAASGLGFVTPGSQWYPMFIVAAVLFYLGLPALFFLQQDPEFPFAVHCAGVLNMVMAVAALSGMAVTYSLLGGPGLAGTDWPSLGNFLRLICCLFGIMSLWKYTLDRDAAPLPRQREPLS